MYARIIKINGEEVLREADEIIAGELEYRNLQLTTYRYTMRYNQYGRRKLKASLVWTEEGRQFLRELIEN